jgi:hypothetical protein
MFGPACLSYAPSGLGQVSRAEFEQPDHDAAGHPQGVPLPKVYQAYVGPSLGASHLWPGVRYN